MGKARYVLVVMLATMVLSAGASRPTLAQNFVAATNGSQFFRVDAEPGQTRKGRPIVRGYVYNTSPYQMTHVRLGVEPLDAGGAATGAPSSGWVNGEIPSNDRRYFEVPISNPGASYRVTVLSFDIRTLDGGGVN